jgi:hypothetical protein
MAPITSDSELTENIPGDAPRVRWRRLNCTPEWLLRVSIESVLIVMSILLALGVDEWRETANNRDLATQSLHIFERELRLNLTELEDNIPYHTGIRDVAAGLVAEPSRLVEVRSIMEGLAPVRRLNPAWETALATGALTRIDVETVSALSLTYSIQQRFRDEMRSGLPRLVVTDEMREGAMLEQMQQAVAYLNEMVQSEQDLRAVYGQALQIIEEARRMDPNPAATRSAAADAR